MPVSKKLQYLNDLKQAAIIMLFLDSLFVFSNMLISIFCVAPNTSIYLTTWQRVSSFADGIQFYIYFIYLKYRKTNEQVIALFQTNFLI